MKEFFRNVYYKYLPHPSQHESHAGTAVLDPAHLGDIHGAFGTIRRDDHPANHKTLWKKILIFLAILGPGIIVMVGDNDAGGVATYAQAGQNFGTSLLWTLLLLVPVLIVNQEMVVRLGSITGVGHARLIIERFGKFWGFFSAGDLFLVNFLTIITEFIGISQAMSYFGISIYISVPIAAAVLIGITLTGSFRRWEQSLFGFIAVSFLMFPLAIMVHPNYATVFKDTFFPRIEGGLTSDALLLIIGIVGTTVAPWQLFFQQSNVIDKRITPRWLSYEKLDTFFGAILTNTGAAALIIAGAALFGTKFGGNFTDALGVAHGLTQTIGARAGDVFAIVLFDASVIGAAAVTLSTAYAFGDVFKTHHSLHRKFSEAKGFYIMYSALVALAAGIVLIPHAPLGL
ncbi:MAG: divalent metal cation transporter, partial [Patescibacteria group bacterium]|nr:divalent metal cation transporter [Patescibacteria group bacterium]